MLDGLGKINLLRLLSFYNWIDGTCMGLLFMLECFERRVSLVFVVASKASIVVAVVISIHLNPAVYRLCASYFIYWL